MEGFKRRPGLGRTAWVDTDAGWRAGLLLEDVAILVNLDGNEASEATAAASLLEALKWRKQQRGPARARGGRKAPRGGGCRWVTDG